jgi:di/tricarboxylate transporter
MSLPVISLIFLIAVIVISCISARNIGVMALGIALIIGYYIGGIKIDEIVKGYPTSLLIMLLGTTFLFALAQTNGTLEKVTKYIIKLLHGQLILLPILLFFVALAIGAAGPGPTVTAALLAPTVMLLSKELGLNPLLLAVMAGNGGHAGGMSPIAVGGIIATGLTDKLGLADMSMVIWFNNILVHLVAAVVAFFVFGGMKLMKGGVGGDIETLNKIEIEPFNRDQIVTLIALACYIAGVTFFQMDIGFGAFLVGTVLVFLKAGDEEKSIKAMPLGAIIMVTGVTVMITIMTKLGGMALFASLIAKFSSASTITLVTGIVSGVISAFASTTGVIMPTFIPMAPILLKEVGASSDQMLPLISTIVACGFVVDMSPLSTSGAIYLANAHPSEDKNRLFRNLLIWGLSIAVVGAIISWLAFSVLQIP